MNRKTDFYQLCDRLSVGAIAVFALECVLGSSGRWLSFGSISIRMVLFAICFVLTLPAVFRQLRALTRTPCVIFALLFGAYLVIAAVIGFRRGNALHFIKSDVTTYMALALLPGFLATVCTENRLKFMSDTVFYGTFALGLITTFMHFFFAFSGDWQIYTINNWLNDHSLGGLATMATGLQRIYMRSQIFLQVGLLLGLQKIWCEKGGKRWLLIAAEAIIAYGCLMTYTRGFWLGFVLSACFLLVLYPKQWKRYLSTLGLTAVLLVGLFLLSWLSYGKPVAAVEIVNRFDPDLINGAVFLPNASGDPSDSTATEETTEPTDPDADLLAVQVRKETLRLINLKIGQHPVFGNGLGTSLDEIRQDGNVEYTYLGVLMELGIVGLLLFCSVFFLPLVPLIKHRIRWLTEGREIPWDSPQMRCTALLAAYLGVAFTSWLNPFLTNPMGILLVLLITTASQQEQTLIKKS